MPGIAGIISSRPAAQCEAQVRAMVASMTHESFYRTGAHFVPSLGVYAGWTALEHSFAEHQVFFNETKEVALLFSGECFPGPETKQWLRQNGHQFSEQDGDWLAHLYEELGDKFFENLNGLFSGLLIDRRKNHACLFNDRYGIQQVYYHEAGGEFYFASEAKALLRILPELRRFDEGGVAEFLAFGCTLEDRTLFNGIKRLPGAARWVFERGDCRKEKYFSPETWEAQPVLAEADYQAKFQATFTRILPHYFGAASKVGIALTGGLDTRMIMAGRPVGGMGQTSYTFTGPHGQTLDDQVAVRVARAAGLDHRLLRLEPDFFSDFAAHVDKTVLVTDGLFGVTGAHEIYFNRRARELAPVRLTGNYGSEILRASSTFKAMPLADGLLSPAWDKMMKMAAARQGDHKKYSVANAAFKEIPWNLLGNLMAGWSQVSFRSPYLDNEIVALACQASAATRHSSRSALRYIKACNPAMGEIPTDRGFIGERRGPGILLRRIYAEVTFKLEYYNNEGLPKKVSGLNPFYRPVASLLGLEGLHKFLRYASWYRDGLRDYLTERLASPGLRQSPFWNPRFINAMAEDHISGRQNYGHEINKVLTLEAVERVLFRDLPR